MPQKTVLVTGGSNGIGEAISKAFIEEGCRVIVFDLKEPSFDTEYYEVDVRKESEVREAFEHIKELDVLVNNAGIYRHTPQDEFDEEDFMDIVKTNVMGYRMMFTYVLPLLQESEDGNVVNISSALARCPEPYSDLYSGAKAFVNSMTQSWAIQENGVRSNTIMVGPVETDMLTENFSEDELEDYLDRQLVDEFTQPEDIAELVSFCASNPQMSGELLSIGGEAGQNQYGV
jgi:NAD(P)-dependent dehydrogenase (short-subunit alcohol dehydrogenase family)